MLQEANLAQARSPMGIRLLRNGAFAMRRIFCTDCWVIDSSLEASDNIQICCVQPRFKLHGAEQDSRNIWAEPPYA